MRELDFRTNYNVLLVDLINGVSRWDHFVAPHLSRYFYSMYVQTPEIEVHLREYAKIKRNLGWDAEADVLNWAYNGFQSDVRFDPLLEHLRFLEATSGNMGGTLKQQLEKVEPRIQEAVDLFNKKFTDVPTKKSIEQLIPVFNTEVKEGTLPAYISFTPYEESRQGGANGEAIIAQIAITGNIEERVNDTLVQMVHEFTHKELDPSAYFKGKEGYDQVYEGIYMGPFRNFVEEVIVYSVNDILAFKIDPQQRIKMIEKSFGGDEINRSRWIRLYEEVMFVTPLLKKYLEGHLTKESLLQSLTDEFNQILEANKEIEKELEVK